MGNRICFGARFLDGRTEMCRFDLLIVDDLVGRIAHR